MSRFFLLLYMCERYVEFLWCSSEGPTVVLQTFDCMCMTPLRQLRLRTPRRKYPAELGTVYWTGIMTRL